METLSAWGAIAWAVVGILIAICLGLVGATKGIRPILDVIHWGEKLNDLVNGQAAINAVVSKQLIPNGDGGSLIRQVEAIRERVEKMQCGGTCPVDRVQDVGAVGE